MPFNIFRDCGKWSAYECAGEWGGLRLATREEAEAEVRRLQARALESEEAGLRIAKARVKEAKEALAKKRLSRAVPLLRDSSDPWRGGVGDARRGARSKMTTMSEFRATIAKMNADFCDGLRPLPPRVVRAYDVSKQEPGFKMSAKYARSGSMTLLAYWT